MKRRKPQAQAGLAARPEDRPAPAHEMSKPQTKLQKLVVRAGAAAAMIAVLAGVLVFGGHVGVAVMLVGITVGIFNELVAVGFSEANSERNLPLYRSLQWLWFVVCMFAAYGHDADTLHAPLQFSGRLRRFVPVVGPSLAAALDAKHYHDYAIFFLYSLAFCATVLALREGTILVQIHILSFTVLSLSLFVVQLKLAVFNVFTGLFWFLFPLLLVAVNDTFAYFAGFLFGRKFVDRPLLHLSKNKTFEGFVGGGLCTLVAGYFLPVLLVHPWLCCGFTEWQQLVDQCPIPVHFLPSADLHGARPIQLHGLALAAFASLVAPFGGFFASAIKRAYGFKDFSNMIPGHGGFMDRLDCQFLMATFTWVHLSTFVLAEPTKLDVAVGALEALSADDRLAALRQLQALIKAG